MSVKEKKLYNKGDLVIINDGKTFKEIAVIISESIPMYHRKYEFYQVFSVCEGHVYIVPCDLVMGEIKT